MGQLNYSAVMILLGFVLKVCAQPQYEVQIQFAVNVVYRGSAIQNSVAGGTCCKPTETAPICTSPCTNVYLTLCFREEQHDVNDMNSSNCPLGGLTNALGRNDLYTFTANPGTTTTTTYPGRIQLLFVIEDRALSPIRLIDCGRIDITREIVDREAGEFIASGLGGKNNIIILTIDQLRVVCKENFTGSDCGSMVCQPRDDPTGHFNCNPDGNKVCLPGYQNPETNCVEAITTTMSTTDPTTTTMETTPTETLPTTTSTPEDSTTTSTPDDSTTTSTPDDSTTTITPNNSTTTITPDDSTSPPTSASVNIAPIAAGAAVGGLVAILILIVVIIIIILVVTKAKNRRINKRIEGVTTVSINTLKNDAYGSPNTGDAGDALPLYTVVNKTKSNPGDEPPPITPYQGDIYTEVEKTGMFGSEGVETTEEAEYGTVAGKDGENGYSSVPKNDTENVLPDEYAEIGDDKPQLVYADVSVSTGDYHPSQDVYENMKVSEPVEYAHIKVP